MATVAPETEAPVKEYEVKAAPQLLVIPTRSLKGQPLPIDYWHRVDDFLRQTIGDKDVIHLYFEGMYSRTLGNNPALAAKDSFDRYHPEFEDLVRMVEANVQASKDRDPVNFDQWSVILSLLQRNNPTIVEVCDDEEACMRTEEITGEIIKAATEREKESLPRKHRSELRRLNAQRSRDFIVRINRTLGKPGEVGILIFGPPDDFLLAGVKSDLKVYSLALEPQ